MAFFNYGTFADTREVPSGPILDVSADITLTGSSQQSSSFTAKAGKIRVVSDADVRYDLGTDPNADNGLFLPAGVVEYRWIDKGRSWKVAAKEV